MVKKKNFELGFEFAPFIIIIFYNDSLKIEGFCPVFFFMYTIRLAITKCPVFFFFVKAYMIVEHAVLFRCYFSLQLPIVN